MAEYIERESLMEQLQKKKYKAARERYNEGFNDAILKVRSMVHSAPTADVAEVRHGKWDSNGEFHQCSVCTNFTSYAYDYCPYCGAEMDLE